MIALSIITAAVFLGVIAALVHGEAYHDFFRTKRDLPIDHWGRGLFRAEVGLVAWIMAEIAITVVSGSWTLGLWLIPAAFGLFSPSFRLMLNSLSGHAPWYMGPMLTARGDDESWYDTVAHKTAWVVNGRKWLYMGRDFSGAPMFVRDYPIRLPAFIAYAFESLVFAGSMTGFIIQLINHAQ